MSAVLTNLAQSVGVNERTLRRAWSLGTIRGHRPSAHALHVPVEERVYIRRHWPTLSRLRRALRTEPGVSMAVVFGSVARGDDVQGSDVDLLVAMQHDDLRSRVMLTERLRQSTGLAIETISLDNALANAALMVEILRDGRVLVDRDNRWREMLGQADRALEQAERDQQLRAARARDAATAFQARAETGR